MFESAELAGAVAFAALAPAALVQLHVGAYVDRAERRRVLICAEAARSAALGSLAVAAAVDELRVPHLLVVLGLDGILATASRIAERATLPAVVEPDMLTRAFSLNEARLRVSTLLGPVAAGGLIGVATSAPFLLCAVAAAASALLCAGLKGKFVVERSEPPTYGADIREGYSWLRHHPFFWWTAWILLATNVIGVAFPIVAIVRLQAMGCDPATIGGVLALLGVGGLVGLLAAPRITEQVRPSRVFTVARWVMALGLLGAATAPTPLLMSAALPPLSMAAAVSNVALGVARIDAVPPTLRARVDSMSTLIANTLAPLGALTAGFLVGGIGPGPTFLAIAVGMFGTAAVATFLPAVRTGDPPPRSSRSER